MTGRMTAFVVVMGCAWMAQGQWPQWRGEGRDGAVTGGARKGKWPAAPELVWERDVGEGYSGPVVVGDRVWVHARRGEKELVSSLRLGKGEVIWSAEYESPFQQESVARQHGRGPFSTPAVFEGRLFTFSITSVLTAWDAAAGKMLWKRESAREFAAAYPYFGAASSPLAWGGMVFVHLGGDDRNSPGQPGRGALVALNAADGRERWRWAGEGPAPGASAIVVEMQDGPHLVVKSQRSIVGFDPRTGRELWRIPSRVTGDNAIVTPLWVKNRLLTSDYDSGVSAWRIDRKQDGSWTPEVVWRHREVSMYMSSPVMAGGLAMGFSHLRRGQLFLLEPETGKVVWRGEPRAGEHATLVVWGEAVMVFQEDGGVVVGDVARAGFQPFVRYQLGRSGGWAHPAIVGDRVIVRDGPRLRCYRMPER